MNHEKQIENLCRIMALMIRRLLTENTASPGQEIIQEFEDHLQNDG
jgi:hypothetical protein